MTSESLAQRIIVADDYSDGAAALAELLSLELSPRVDVVVVHDGAAAVELATDRSVQNVVVLDIDMPDMTGIEAAAEIRTSADSTHAAVLVAMSGDDDLLVGAQRSGHFQATFRKPIEVRRLLGLLRGASA